MTNVCCLTGFRLCVKNLPKLTAKLQTTHQVNKLGLQRIIRAINHHPYQVAEAEEIEWINGVAINTKNNF